ncbi:MAG TPA: HPP family protein [Acidobacteriaceae bacterium]
MSRKDLLIAPVLEGLLILIVALVGWIARQPLVFASLGPTAFEMIETPKRPSARPYNVIVGNAIAILAAFGALLLTHAWEVPSVSSRGVPLPRVWAAVLAAALTVLGTLLLRATQPAALSTALLIALGILQTWRDGVIIIAAVLIMAVAGEPLRRWRAKNTSER